MPSLSVTRQSSPVLSLESYTVGILRYGYLTQEITHADLTAAATTEAISITGFPANAYPIHGRVGLKVAFSGGSVSELTVQLGDTADPDGLMTAVSVFTGASLDQLGAAGIEAGIGTAALESAYAPEALFTATGDNVVNLDAGKLEVRIAYIQIIDPDDVIATGV